MGLRPQTVLVLLGVFCAVSGVRGSNHGEDAMTAPPEAPHALPEVSGALPEVSDASRNSSSAGEEEEQAAWIAVFDAVQLTCIIVGLLANVFTLVTLWRSGKDFSRPVLLLFRHQSVADCLVCLLAAIIMLQPFMWLTGVHALDVLVCRF